MNQQDQEFLHEMVVQLNATIRQVAAEERALVYRIGAERVAELAEFWKKELSVEEELRLKNSFDHWDKQLIRIWARLKRAHHTRAEVGQTLMKMNVRSGR
ncbi:MAG: hypothetical protein NTY50_06510 [Methylobacter sp.]|jgi:hypothetical protein|nr:hypothetical protein [Methylobacter sp.]